MSVADLEPSEKYDLYQITVDLISEIQEIKYFCYIQNNPEKERYDLLEIVRISEDLLSCLLTKINTHE